jgi:hypothetical protein
LGVGRAAATRYVNVMSRHVLTLFLLVGCGKAMPKNITTMDAGCAITVEDWPLEEATHVPIGSNIEWASNPPASGPHFPQWAAFQEYSSPVPRGYWVHGLEHGAVVLLYNCAEGVDCEPIKQALRDASAAIPSDGMCAAPVRVRTVITPDPLIETPIAAVAWGHVYRAACVDSASLAEFAKLHYAKGPENLCAAGVTSF